MSAYFPHPAPSEQDERLEALLHQIMACRPINMPDDLMDLDRLVMGWVVYERDLTRFTIESKLKAERERAIEEAAIKCEAVGECALADAIRALKVMP